MLLIILTAILASLTYAGCNARNYYRKAIKEDGLAPNVIPESFYRSYYRDWFLLLAILLVVGVGAGLLLNAI